jgi:molecular chaperone GrpE (heat shock protein)
MRLWIVAHQLLVAVVLAAIALVGAIVAIVVVVVVARRLMRIKVEHRQHGFDSQDNLRRISDQVLMLERQSREISASFSEQTDKALRVDARLTTLTELLARDRQQSLSTNLCNDEALKRLSVIYKEALQSMAATIRTLGSVRSHVEALLSAMPSDSRQYTRVMAAVSEFRALEAMISEIEARPQVIEKAMTVETQLGLLEEQYRSGTLTTDSLLRALFEFTIPSEFGFPDPELEGERLENMPEMTRTELLRFVDSVTEVRDELRDAKEVAGASECDEIIRICADFLDGCGIRLVDVARGTVFDARLHDLYAAIPSAAASPETIIGIRRLGQRKGGQLVRKPQVLVAAAS